MQRPFGPSIMRNKLEPYIRAGPETIKKRKMKIQIEPTTSFTGISYESN